ncbi:hypothetical protein [Geomonas anaerohicana]|uniref:DUF2268 domain-containing protein n=1 Tax=Geomonas anaerohicana TaxID=2798583 RepID=A0ABS0YCM4_9BACT|nr:hypothetical protein [Geomonas anaerohicana]MBJ6749894.1 hypothetical protein [Geomonas anaerohicana]
MARKKVSIRNRKLAFPETLTFIKFLCRKYPTSPVTITFERNPILSFGVEGCSYICHIKGACTGTEVRVSVFETDLAEQLRVLAHEYRHAMQTNLGMYPDSEAGIFMMVNLLVKCHGGAEQDAVKFSQYSVEEFLREISP